MLRVAVVGAGGMARHYRRAYTTLPNVEWAVAIDLDADQLALCKKEGAKETTGDFSAALQPGIDIVDVSTPNHLHQGQAIAALEAGKHVLLQKPIANTLAAADHIVAAARQARQRKGNILGMYMSSYANPIMWEIKRLVADGHIGRIQSIRARDSHRGGLTTKPGAGNWRGSKTQTGGGSFIQLSIHAINLMQWWVDAPISQVSAFIDNCFCPNIGGDDICVANVKFNNGIYGTFDSAYASEGMSREIYGTQGSIRLVHYDVDLELLLDKPYKSELIDYDTPGKPKVFPAPKFDLSDTVSPFNPQRMFVEAVTARTDPFMGPDAGRRDLAVVMAAYQSAAHCGVVTIPPPDSM